ncbi:hypothetical protein [Pseudorhodobacter sp. MZDSW-24AT]|uniref:hypothetical protein n=1 Tax=Pseudorhodobacter sp. MZDSW-24AT TaxID=2052957 RepID=UPI000C1DD6C1|nr:hypothetical protein [Pseudorhodobacter sp. MZDSW-24AT]PJF08407.1 hypothetical protein CUR21_13315 [Pseudorhodobacter sp. MZDSW-24AT]
MAKAGDGAPRSNKRRRQALIQIRVSTAEHLMFLRAAQKCGAHGLAGWARDQLRNSCGNPSASDRMLSGALGQLASQMQDIARLTLKVPSEKIAQEILRVSQDLRDLQRKVIDNDREGVP